MKIMVCILGNRYLGFSVGPDCGSLLAALPSAAVYEQNWTINQFVPAGTEERPDPLEVKFVDDKYFAPLPPLTESLKKKIDDESGRWVEWYNKAHALEKELNELKIKVAGLSPAKAEGIA